MSATALHLHFDNSYARDLEGAFVAWQPAESPLPRLVKVNRDLAQELGLDPDALESAAGLAVLAGNTVPEGAFPIAQAYAGHQFGGFSPQLGDGRALLLGELIDRHGRRRDIAFKGSGRTPFSRGGDGKAALGPVLREYLVGEAMHALGIPTTRALAAVCTGEVVRRDGPLPGALLTRVAASHLRVGTFQYFAARDQVDLLQRVADHAIARHDPQLVGREDRYLGLLQAVVQRQAALVARWMGVGFIHGVMNTDNTTISGETIDYGPCAFMEAFNPQAVFSSIDHHGRYAFGNQPGIAQWNLARLAETLLPLIDSDPDRAVGLASEVVNGFAGHFRIQWLQVMRAKLGLDAADGADDEDIALAESFLKLMHQQQVDHTLGWRRLADAAGGRGDALAALFPAEGQPALGEWLARWQARRSGAGHALALALEMHRANPIYIARNHQVEAALAAAVDGKDLAPFERLLAVLQSPFDERPQDAAYAEPAPAEATACYQTFCGT
ncbi:hypothetical protein BurJ1DRAFT_2728 [Burkholderiales bacterium JOSHI_001]|nr:hypothetical protein BurJ1DRAFT_2728 [Burkholderiales bacterium JOSHI_001]